jgi:hypothetical protein
MDRHPAAISPGEPQRRALFRPHWVNVGRNRLAGVGWFLVVKVCCQLLNAFLHTLDDRVTDVTDLFDGV